MDFYTYSGASWRKIKNAWAYAGGWQQVKKAWVYVNGIWKQFYTSTVSPSIESQVSISQSTSGTTGLVTLTGQNNYWTNSTSLNYDFNHSTGGSYTSIKSGGATNPSGSGGSTTNPYILGTLSASDVTANTSNYYTYSVTAYNSTYSTTTISTSSSTTVEGARNISNLATSNPGYYSVDLSWTAGAYNNSYRVRYGTVSGSLSSYVDVSGTSTTISGLSMSTTYYFTVTPYTGSIVSSAVTGYAGNTSSEVSRATNTPPAPSDPTGINVYKYDPTTTTNNLIISWNASSGATGYSYDVYDYVTGAYLYYGATTTNTYTSSLNVGNSRTIYVAVQAYNAGGYSPKANYIIYNCGPAPVSPTSASLWNYYIDGTGHIYSVNGGAGHGWMIQSNQYSSLFSSSSASYITPYYYTHATGTAGFLSGTTYYPINYGNLTAGRAYKTRIYSFTTGRSFGSDSYYTSSSPYTFYYVRALAQATPSTPTVTSSPSYTINGSGLSRTLNYDITLTHNMSNLHHIQISVLQFDNGIRNDNDPAQSLKYYATTGYETNNAGSIMTDQLSSESYTSSFSQLNIPIPIAPGHTYTYKIYINALGLGYTSGWTFYTSSPAIIDVV